MAKLYVKLGCMNTGKSTALLQVANNYEETGSKVLIMKPSIDTKGDDAVVSRLGIKRKVDVLVNQESESILDNETTTGKPINFDGISCILVDEAQFMSPKHVFELWTVTKVLDIPVIAYALKVNFRGELFEGTKALLQYGEKIDTQSQIAMCSCGCGKKAKFNARRDKDTLEFDLTGPEVKIDGTTNDEYLPLCGDCFYKLVASKKPDSKKVIEKVKGFAKKEH